MNVAENNENQNIEILNEKANSSKNKYLVFQLGDEKFGVVLSSVKEVVGLPEITVVPEMPSFFKGLINLRGEIISIIDLRIKLKLQDTKYDSKKTSVIIADVNNMSLGIVVDDVNEVARYRDDQLEGTADIQSKVQKDYLQGVAKTDDNKLVLLIDIVKLFGTKELEVIKSNLK